MTPRDGGPTLAPAERVRRRIARELGDAVAGALPSRYQRLGRVLVLDLPETLRPGFGRIGAAWIDVLGVEAVLRRSGPVEGELRRPGVEVIAGGPTETTVLEHGVTFGFDAARIMFARGNKTERHRIGTLVRPGEDVVDLFAGIGYFALPALVTGGARSVRAVEKNPVAFGYLEENLRRNRVADRGQAILGDNRTLRLAPGRADRVVLGYLPSAIPWIPVAVPLLRPGGGVLHVHLVADVRGGAETARREVEGALRGAGRRPARSVLHEVKPYGPGRAHLVVDVEVGPA